MPYLGYVTFKKIKPTLQGSNFNGKAKDFNSPLIEEGTENRYRLPSVMSVAAKTLYQVMGVKRIQTIKKM